MMTRDEVFKYVKSSDFEVERHFGPKIYAGKLTDETYDKLIEMSEKVRGNVDYDFRNKLAGNLSEEYNLFQYNDDKYKSVFEEIRVHCALYDTCAKEGLAEAYEHSLRIMKLESIWVNFQKPFEWNPEHNHSGDISFVIYLKTPNDMNAEREHETQKGNSPTAGSISFGYGEDSIYNSTSLNIEPKERDIIVFPHWLRHQVYPFTTDVERWSVAGNAYTQPIDFDNYRGES